MKRRWFGVWYGQPKQKVFQGWWYMTEVEASLMASELAGIMPHTSISYTIARVPEMTIVEPRMGW